MKEPIHEPTICLRQGRTRYITGGGVGVGHSQEFRCPRCGRVGRFHLNYLGARLVLCNGQKFSREHPVGRTL